MTDQLSIAENHLKWLKKTAEDNYDHGQIVGFADCLISWKESLRRGE